MVAAVGVGHVTVSYDDGGRDAPAPVPARGACATAGTKSQSPIRPRRRARHLPPRLDDDRRVRAAARRRSTRSRPGAPSRWASGSAAVRSLQRKPRGLTSVAKRTGKTHENLENARSTPQPLGADGRRPSERRGPARASGARGRAARAQRSDRDLGRRLRDAVVRASGRRRSRVACPPAGGEPARRCRSGATARSRNAVRRAPVGGAGRRREPARRRGRRRARARLRPAHAAAVVDDPGRRRRRTLAAERAAPAARRGAPTRARSPPPAARPGSRRRAAAPRPRGRDRPPLEPPSRRRRARMSRAASTPLPSAVAGPTPTSGAPKAPPAGAAGSRAARRSRSSRAARGGAARRRRRDRFSAQETPWPELSTARSAASARTPDAGRDSDRRDGRATAARALR